MPPPPIRKVLQMVDVAVPDGTYFRRDGDQVIGISLAPGEDAYYLHTQGVASAVWVIPHNLGKYPAVTVVNSADDEVEGALHYDSVNQVTVSFNGAFTGRAFCS